MHNAWIYRFLILSSFILFDSTATSVLISHADDESNSIARMSLTTFGNPLGLALFSLGTAGFLSLILYFFKSVISEKSGPLVLLSILALDFCLGWFVAGVHFVGGTSWFWSAPDLLRHLVGASIYMLIMYTFTTRSVGKTMGFLGRHPNQLD